MKKLLLLFLADMKNTMRDSTLMLLCAGPVLVWLFLKLLIPLAADFALVKFGADISGYYPLILIYMSLLPSMLFGMVIGFIILDERDEDIISYIAVTPVGRKGYFLYKIIASFTVSFLFFFIIMYTTGLSNIPFGYSIALAFMAALEAPFASFFLASFAENKVEGLALSKILGIMYVSPFAAYFVKSDLQFIAGILPPFWIAKAFFEIPFSIYNYSLYILIGIFIHLVFLALIVKKFLQMQK